jgi:hypothetical protein
MFGKETNRMEQILSQLFKDPHLMQCTPISGGHIHQTYLTAHRLPSGEVQKLVVQKLNNSIFTNPWQVMENTKKVLNHIQKKQPLISSYPDFSETLYHQTLEFLSPASGEDFLKDSEGSLWRVSKYIQDSVSYHTVPNPSIAKEMGICLGVFHEMLSDMPTHFLHDTLPFFHHTEKVVAEYEKIKLKPEPSIPKEIEEDWDWSQKIVDKYGWLASKWSYHHLSQLEPFVVVHNDPKCSNFLFSPSGKAICLIDLDTVKGGFVKHDVGDALRSILNQRGEEGRPGLPQLDETLSLFRFFVEGYRQARPHMTLTNDYFLSALSLILFELGVRFLNSWLKNDGYFPEKYPHQNLERAMVQLNLLEFVEQNQNDFLAI